MLYFLYSINGSGVMSQIIGTKKASEMLGVSRRWVRELIKLGRIEGQQLGREWVTTVEAVEKYQSEQSPIKGGEK